MNMMTELGVVCLQSKEHQRLPANHQKLGQRHGIDASSQPSKGTNPANIQLLLAAYNKMRGERDEPKEESVRLFNEIWRNYIKAQISLFSQQNLQIKKSLQVKNQIQNGTIDI